MNRLACALSPYLRQHADNPVEWQPWDARALAQARAEDKPILLSAGYAACHWCHVMAHESFEDAETAAVMNENFICIKIDREERPDLDRIYQAAHYIFTQRAGGWPLTMFLSPDGAPFFGGTYFPRGEGRGLPSFISVLERTARAWRERRGEIEKQNARVLPFLRGLDVHPPHAGAMTDAPARAAAAIFGGMIDRKEGGFGGAPKFPHAAEFAFCLAAARAFADDGLLSGAELTLQKIAAGGLADHVGGGFFRYAVDGRWTVPHFEKMLSDNGLLLALFADAARVFDSPQFARAAEHTADWALSEMRDAGGGFYSSLDADSDGGEGAFYVWDAAEIKANLPPAEYAVWESHFGLAAGPNFDGKHHLVRRQTAAQTAAALKISPAECAARLESARARLRKLRGGRPRPATDDKILAGWNALMIRGLARAGRVLRRPEWVAAARAALDFIRREMVLDGRLHSPWRGGKLGGAAFLDDCAFALDAALELLRAEFCPEVLEFARALAAQLRAHFEDAENGGFFFTPADGEPLIRRPKPAEDESSPCGNAVAARALLLLPQLTGESEWARAGERTLAAFYSGLQKRPAGGASMLSALRFYLSPPPLVFLCGGGAECARWRDALDADLHVFILPEDVSGLPPLLQKPPPKKGAAAHVCAEGSCLPLVNSLPALKTLLEKL